MLFLTADQHFNHTNILKYEAKNRPFESVEAMNAELIRRWNDVISKDDQVFHLGDFCFGNNRGREILKELHGHKIIIKGNHDPSIKKLLEMGWDEAYKEYILYDDHVAKLYLKHNPDKVVNPPCKNIIHGHVHGLWASLERDGHKFINVGVDVRDLSPVSLLTIEKELI